MPTAAFSGLRHSESDGYFKHKDRVLTIARSGSVRVESPAVRVVSLH